MPDLLLELFSEEIPARMQAKAADDLKKMVTDRLVDTGLVYEGAKAFATPRRLALTIQGVPARQPDLKEEKKGPRVGAPEAAVQGFLKSTGLSSLDEAKIEKDPKKGDFYVALIEKPGRPAIDVLAEMLPVVIRTFPWPKSMRWGERSGRGGALAWVRPLHAVVATFGPETEEPEVVRFEVDGVAAGDVSRGHRFLAPQPFRVRRLDDYAASLEKAKVVLDPERRKAMILADARNLAFAQGYELIEDSGLLDEVAGLVEWPVVLMGAFDKAFLAIPPEVIRTTIRANQKCFVLRDPQTAKLADRFVLVANIEASDGGKAIVAGNERVIRARLSDAKFFYETDLKTKLEARLGKFREIVFHEKLGTQWERIERIERLAAELAPLVGADIAKARRAALLCKADLLTEVVGEFPELQGLMGKYYAEAQGEDEAVAHACEDHYRPQGPNDLVPADPVSIAVALADKIDTLVGFWAIDEKPTGSKDPYALRRAALGVIGIVLRNEIRLDLGRISSLHFDLIVAQSKAEALTELIHIASRLTTHTFDANDWKHDIEKFVALTQLPLVGAFLKAQPGFAEFIKALRAWHGSFETRQGFIHYSGNHSQLLHELRLIAQSVRSSAISEAQDYIHAVQAMSQLGTAGKLDGTAIIDTGKSDLVLSLLVFFADRLKVQLREQGARHDLVDAVFALEGQDDLLLIVRRVEALGKFLDTDDGKNLLAGTKRAANILRIEEKKDAVAYAGAPNPELYRQAEEWELAKAIDLAKEAAAAAVAREDFAAAMSAMATLRPHVDAFFDKVTVNADDKPVRENRLKLLAEIRAATRAVADFSKIEG